MPYVPADIRVRVDTRRASLRIANAAVVTMTQRAMGRGQGVNDAPHAPYTARYRRTKAHTGHVDLTVTGRMRRSLRAEPQGDGSAVIRLRGPGRPDYARHTNARRPWFGLSRADRRQLRPIIRRVVRQAMVAPKGAR